MSPPERESRPGDDTRAAQLAKADIKSTCRQLRARRTAAQRLPLLDCGRSDPWHYPPSERGYEEAAAHLLELGLLPAPNREGLVAMWRRGGHSRQAAEFIAERWDLVA